MRFDNSNRTLHKNHYLFEILKGGIQTKKKRKNQKRKSNEEISIEPKVKKNTNISG